MTERPDAQRTVDDVGEHRAGRGEQASRLGRIAAAVRAAAHRTGEPQPPPMTVGDLATARGLTTAAFPTERPAVDLSKRQPSAPAAAARPEPVASPNDPVGSPAEVPSADGVAEGSAPARPSAADAEAERLGQDRPESAPAQTPADRSARPEGAQPGRPSLVEPPKSMRSRQPAGPSPFQRPAGPLPPPPPRPPNRFSVPARPPVVDEYAILGLTRRSRGRIGSRVFVLFFVFVYAVIALQLIAVLFGPSS